MSDLGGSGPIRDSWHDPRGSHPVDRRMLPSPETRWCLAALCCLGWATPTAAEQVLSQPNLARAVAIFERADADRNGSLDAHESLEARIPRADVQCYDRNRDGRLSRDEFVTYYRRLLAEAGVRVSRDLEAESVRIQAMRRAQRAREDRGRNAESSSVDPAVVTPSGTRQAAGRIATTAPALAPVQRAKALLRELSSSAELGPTDARDLQALQALVAAPGTAASRERARGHIGRLRRGGILDEAQELELRAVLVDPPPPTDAPPKPRGTASGSQCEGSVHPPAKEPPSIHPPGAAGSDARAKDDGSGSDDEAPRAGPFR